MSVINEEKKNKEKQSFPCCSEREMWVIPSQKPFGCNIHSLCDSDMQCCVFIAIRHWYQRLSMGQNHFQQIIFSFFDYQMKYRFTCSLFDVACKCCRHLLIHCNTSIRRLSQMCCSEQLLAAYTTIAWHVIKLILQVCETDNGLCPL